MKKSQGIFEFIDYKDYLLNSIFFTEGRGIRTRIAKAINCDLAYLSRVLNDNAQLSLEQADLLSVYLGHNPQERHYFILMVELTRAGTSSLKKYFKDQMSNVQNERTNLKARLQDTMALLDYQQAKYYSSWHYAAIHMMIAIPQFQNPQALSKELKLPHQKVQRILEDLVDFKLAYVEKGKYTRISKNIHIDSDDLMISKHHSNWRLKAMESLDQSNPATLHYSSIVSLSLKDVPLLKEKMLEAIEEIRKTVKDSGDEVVWCYAMDLFPVR